MKLHPGDIHDWLTDISSYFMNDIKRIEKQIEELRNESVQIQLYISLEPDPAGKRLYNLYEAYRIHGVVVNQKRITILYVDTIFPTFAFNCDSYLKTLTSHATILRDAMLLSLNTNQTKTLRLHFLPDAEL